MNSAFSKPSATNPAPFANRWPKTTRTPRSPMISIHCSLGIGGHDAASCPPIPSPGCPAPCPGHAGPRCRQTLLRRKAPGPISPSQSAASWRRASARGASAGRKDKADPVYYNTGSCVHPRCITGIEITAAPPKDDGPIRPHFTLVKWGYLEEKPGRLPRKNRGDSAEEKPGRLPIFSFRKIGSCTGFSGPQDGSCTGFSGPQAGSK